MKEISYAGTSDLIVEEGDEKRIPTAEDLQLDKLRGILEEMFVGEGEYSVGANFWSLSRFDNENGWVDIWTQSLFLKIILNDEETRLVIEKFADKYGVNFHLVA